MSAKPKTIADVRDHLFTLMDQLADKDKEPNYERIRATCEIAQVIVNTVRVQVDYLRVIQGDGDLPFLDEQPGSPDGSLPPGTTLHAKADTLSRGPSPNHPWRTVHRISRD